MFQKLILSPAFQSLAHQAYSNIQICRAKSAVRLSTQVAQVVTKEVSLFGAHKQHDTHRHTPITPEKVAVLTHVTKVNC